MRRIIRTLILFLFSTVVLYNVMVFSNAITVSKRRHRIVSSIPPITLVEQSAPSLAPTTPVVVTEPVSADQTDSVPTTSLPSISTREKRRTLSNIEYFLSDGDLPTDTFSSPALVVVGCSRMYAILACFTTLFQLPDINSYSLYLSVGCPNVLAASTIGRMLSEQFGSNASRITLLDYGGSLLHSSNKRLALYHIHLHYNAMLRRLFEEKSHSHVLVVEDDLQLAPTALHFLRQVVPALDADPSLVCLSLFNDNAEAEDRDPLLLHRSSSFPNLGLLFNRRGYDLLWRNASLSFRTIGWDHWVRQSAAARDLECLFPALPRLRHLIYAEGTTVNLKTKSRIDRLPVYDDPRPVDLGDVSYVLRANYDRSLLGALLPARLVDSSLRAMRVPMGDILRGAPQRCAANRELDWRASRDLFNADKTRVVISDPFALHRYKDYFATAGFDQFLLLVADENYALFAPFLRLSGAKRGTHHGILFFTQNGHSFFLLDRRRAWYALPEADVIRYDPTNVVQLSGFDESCSEVCAKYSEQHPQTPYVCDTAQLQYVNRCSVLQEFFPCEKGCYSEVGQDLPAYVAFGSPEENGVCLFSFDVQPLCEYAMTKTRRLCVCTKQESRVSYPLKPLVLMETRKEMQKRSLRKPKH